MTIGLLELVSTLRGAGVPVDTPEGLQDTPVVRVSGDSRRVAAGTLFVAWAGARHDGHDHLSAAAGAGAVAALVQRRIEGAAIPQLVVDQPRRALALAADAAAGRPWESLRVVGVTGTNGKTTTALILRSLLAHLGPSAAIGTLGLTDANGHRDPATEGLTTPGADVLSEWLRRLVDDGAACLSMEASSHALDQHRLDGIRFDAMVFTNLTRDHLDYHGGWNEYREAKARLLELGKPGAPAVLNADVEAWQALRPAGPVWTYGVNGEADVRATDVEYSPKGAALQLSHRGERAPVRLPLPGRFNVQNALAAAATALALGLPLAECAAGLEAVPPVPGRMERVEGGPVDVLIDFAHTPDALDRVLETVRPVVEGRLIVVFGAGGDRDPSKRPKMGEAVSRHGDIAVVTSDNPRTEDPDQIAAQVFAGVSGVRAEQIVDRSAAIAWALSEARPGDMVVLAGKGHETYQVVGTEKRPFDERQIVEEFFASRRAS